MLHKENDLRMERLIPSVEAFGLNVAFVLWRWISGEAASGCAVCLGVLAWGSLVHLTRTDYAFCSPAGDRETVLFHLHISGTISNQGS